MNVNTYLFLFVRPKAACYCTAERATRIPSTGVTGLTWLARAGRMEMQTERRLALRQQLMSNAGTIIEQNGDGLLEDSHMPVGWPLHIDGAVRQCCIHRSATLQELDDMLGEYDMKRDSVEINHRAPQWSIMQCGTENT